jgi:AraC-like DNA-binding protein
MPEKLRAISAHRVPNPVSGRTGTRSDARKHPRQGPDSQIDDPNEKIMISIPLPHVVALFLLVVLIAMGRNGEFSRRENWPFIALITVYMLQSVLIGLRWGYDILSVLPYQASVAPLIAGLAWISFSSLARPQGTGIRQIWPHLLPAAAAVAIVAFSHEFIGPFIVLVFLAYGAALLRLGWSGTDRLVVARLDGALRSLMAMRLTGAAMIASALSDIAINLDLSWSGGRYSGAVIAGGNVIMLLALGLAAFAANEGRSLEEEGESPQDHPPSASVPSEQDAEIAASVERLMRESELYRDMELNLGKIARRLRQPSRSISNAINRVHGVSVSQYVNGLRIAAACRLLDETEDSITSVIYASGFMTKSNFNREFNRVTGMTPSDWRRRRQHARGVSVTA